jgi:hypothetical protein
MLCCAACAPLAFALFDPDLGASIVLALGGFTSVAVGVVWAAGMGLLDPKNTRRVGGWFIFLGFALLLPMSQAHFYGPLCQSISAVAVGVLLLAIGIIGAFARPLATSQEATVEG